MTRRIPLLAHGLNLALFGALLGARGRTRTPHSHRPEKLHYQPRRFRRPPDEPGD